MVYCNWEDKQNFGDIVVVIIIIFFFWGKGGVQEELHFSSEDVKIIFMMLLIGIRQYSFFYYQHTNLGLSFSPCFLKPQVFFGACTALMIQIQFDHLHFVFFCQAVDQCMHISGLLSTLLQRPVVIVQPSKAWWCWEVKSSILASYQKLSQYVKVFVDYFRRSFYSHRQKKMSTLYMIMLVQHNLNQHMALGHQPQCHVRQSKRILGGSYPNLRGVLVRHQTKRASHGPLDH